ncbi:nucleolar protein 11-like [Schistocerca nitens]|uniref:nucleolar protein 11-like n=1 Tax=Schistocerca nitens TaxID=7011 RepID=UPI0021175B94|nr:nucleolar protein 11-like [Schistocerca nitens]
MAKLGVAYGLCPLIDESSLLGVTDDSQPGTVLVTLGRNIVIRYKLQDQKQIGSWSTKSRLTSPVIYDKANKQYVGVFHYNQIRTWTENDDRLDKANKIKFQEPINCILSSSEEKPPIVLFKNGCVLPLDAVLQKSKEDTQKPVLASDEEIEDSYIISSEGRNYVTFLARNSKNGVFLYVIPVVGSRNEIQKVNLNRDEPDITLKGFTVVQDSSSCHIFTLWSDGKLFSLNIFHTSDIKSPGNFVQAVSCVNTKNPVVLKALSSTYLMLYGADPSEEGAFMLVLNLQFRLVKSRLHFKLFSPRPQVWRVQSALLLPVGLSLVVVPFHIGDERLAALLGTSRPLLSEAGLRPAIVADWGTTSDTGSSVGSAQNIFSTAPNHIRERLEGVASDGWPQALIFCEILPHLIQKKDVKSLEWCLRHLTDLPEDGLVQVLSFCLSANDTVFDSGVPAVDGDTSFLMNGVLDDDADIGTNKIMKIKPLSPPGRAHLLQLALNAHVSDAKLTAHLRTLPLDEVLLLLRHLVYQLQQDVTDVRLLNWSCTVLDAHYQQLLLSRDNQVAQLLAAFHQIVIGNLSCMKDLETSAAILHRLKAGKPLKKRQCSNKAYSIETLRLY